MIRFLPVGGGLSLARRLHIIGAYWGYLLMGLHMGNHWHMVLAVMRKTWPADTHSKPLAAFCFLIGLLVTGYGAFVFAKRYFMAYLLLRSEFVFLDYGEPIILFYIDYLALMGLCIFIAHYVTNLCRFVHSKRRQHDEEI